MMNSPQLRRLGLSGCIALAATFWGFSPDGCPGGRLSAQTQAGGGDQAEESPGEVIQLFEGRAPGAVGDEGEDRPTITLYRPDAAKSTGAAVVVCPGGGYGHLAVDHEGEQIARWFNSLGITAAVLRYRIAPRYHHPAPLTDVSRAIRTVRAKAKQWGLDPARVGVMGFSAGGHLASTVATHFTEGDPKSEDLVERVSSRPDVAILCYPVISFMEPFTHAGSRRNLLGDKPEEALVEEFSNERQVTPQTPPTFLFHTTTDRAVPPENSVVFYLALRKAEVPCELHIFEQGRHGVGLAAEDPALKVWPKLCARWLAGKGFIEAPSSAGK
jgi:acetyl esterase/lipase